jgi:diguanylate cyclase (GGDEF)-like protein
MVDLPHSLEHQLKLCRTLPSVPTVVIEVLDLCEKEDISISEIATVLARDPALTAKVLRIANSAFYGVRSQVTTVNRAISIMGINATLSLALSFSFVDNLSKSSRRGFDHIAYWRRSGITAAAARSLVQWTDGMSREELFLAGLLQDIGMLVLNEALHETYGDLIASANRQHLRLIELETASLGTDHGAVGAWMLRRWKLPKKLIHSLAASHNHHLMEEFPKADYLKVLALASHIAEIWCDPETAKATGNARQWASRMLQMSNEQFDRVLGSIASALPEITRDLDIDVGGEEQANKLLNQAREALVIISLQAQRQVHYMRNLAETDSLTSLYNRGYLESILPQFFEEARHTNQPLSVIFADIDHFKQINDSFGHQLGDSILVSVARILKSAMRTTDIAARYGGEEFVCLLPNTPEEDTQMVAERLRNAISLARHKGENNQEIKVTISFGCATFSSEDNFGSPVEFLEAADRCLYVAKRTGRNRVVSAKSLPAEAACEALNGDGSRGAHPMAAPHQRAGPSLRVHPPGRRNWIDYPYWRMGS